MLLAKMDTHRPWPLSEAINLDVGVVLCSDSLAMCHYGAITMCLLRNHYCASH